MNAPANAFLAKFSFHLMKKNVLARLPILNRTTLKAQQKLRH